MRFPFYFSDYFKPAGAWMKFAAVVIARFTGILFRKNKDIELLELDYSTKYLFDSSLLVISYRFKNALWFDFPHLKKTTKQQSIVFNIKNTGTNNIQLIVYGFFRKKAYQIHSEPETTLKVKSFKTTLTRLNENRSYVDPISVSIKKMSLDLPNMEVALDPITIDHSSYNQTDFI